MTGQELLGNVAFYVSLIVVIAMAITFSILFGIYGYYKIKHIKYGHEDIQLEKSLRNRYKEIIRKNEDKNLKMSDVEHGRMANKPDYVLVQNDPHVKTFTLVGEKEIEEKLEPTTVVEAILEEKKKSKKWRVVSNIFFAIFYILLLILLGVSIAFNVTNRQLYIGNQGLVTIRTGSMETANENNDYLFEEGLDKPEDRIVQYSLIGVTKVTSPEDMELYKIYGYRTEDNILVFHRLIRIYTSPESGITYYTFRGDANEESLSFELLLEFDDIECMYSGFQNYGLGVAITYLQSNIGLIAILSAFIFLITYQTTEYYIEKAYDARTQFIAKEIDAGKIISSLPPNLTKKQVKKMGEKI